jgi:hypothetical protein
MGWVTGLVLGEGVAGETESPQGVQTKVRKTPYPVPLITNSTVASTSRTGIPASVSTWASGFCSMVDTRA